MELEEGVNAAVKQMKESLMFRDMKGDEYRALLNKRVRHYTGRELPDEDKIHTSGSPEARLELLVEKAQSDAGIIQHEGLKGYYCTLGNRELEPEAAKDVSGLIDLGEEVLTRLKDKYGGKPVPYKQAQDDAIRLFRRHVSEKDAVRYAFILVLGTDELNIKRD